MEKSDVPTPPSFQNSELDAQLELPDALLALIDAGVWASFHGHDGSGQRLLSDEALFRKLGFGTLAMRNRPFRSYAGWAEPFKVTPEIRLLEASYGPTLDVQERGHRELQEDRALHDLDPALAIEIAVFDSYDLAGIILDYRVDPPPVLRLSERTPDSPAHWVEIAKTFDEFAAIVGLEVNGPLYWHAYDDESTLGTLGPEGGTIAFDQQHPLGPRITVERLEERAWTISSVLEGEVFHTRRMTKSYHYDLTGAMKRALGEMAIAGFPTALKNDFVERFEKPPA